MWFTAAHRHSGHRDALLGGLRWGRRSRNRLGYVFFFFAAVPHEERLPSIIDRSGGLAGDRARLRAPARRGYGRRCSTFTYTTTGLGCAVSRNRYNDFVGSLRILLAMVAVSALQAAPAIFPLKDVRAGQHGIGRTVFSGSRVQEFQVEILGVLENLG